MSDSELPGAPTECQSIYKSQPASLAGGKRRRRRATRKAHKGRKGKRTARKHHRISKAKKSRSRKHGKKHAKKHGKKSRRHMKNKKHGKKSRRSHHRRMRGGNPEPLANVPYTPSFSAAGINLSSNESALANPVPYTATNNCGRIPRS